MFSGLPVVRLLAAMILAIFALAAPSAAGAHEGHARAGHHPVAAEASPIAVTPAAVERVVRASAVVAVSALVPSESMIGADDRDGAACGGLHGICCCGAACCASGILAAATDLSGPVAGRTRLRPYDPVARAGLGPEALTEPPRPLA